MTATDDGTLLLRAILENPAEDTLRLAFADWLEENDTEEDCSHCHGGNVYSNTPWEEGQRPAGFDKNGLLLYAAKCRWCRGSGRVGNGARQRAEFIRGDIAAFPPEERKRVGPHSWALTKPQRLHQWAFPGFRAIGWDRDWVCYTPNDGTTSVKRIDVQFSRGFVCAVQTTAELWIQWADAIVAAHPVERVRLTTHPDIMEMFRLNGGDSPGNVIAHHEAILNRRWPRAAFELPRD